MDRMGMAGFAQQTGNEKLNMTKQNPLHLFE
jgi:hypothetical protein